MCGLTRKTAEACIDVARARSRRLAVMFSYSCIRRSCVVIFRAFDSVALVLGLKQLGSSINSGTQVTATHRLLHRRGCAATFRAIVPLRLSSVRRATQLNGCSETGLPESAMLSLPIDLLVHVRNDIL